MFVRFLLIHELFWGGWEGSAGGLFPFFPLLSGPDVGEAGETRPRKEQHKIDSHDRKGRKRLLFFNHFYICWFRKIQIFMVNGSSRDLFKMHCAWNLYVLF